MTKDEIINYLIGELKEEFEGIIKYNEMYEAACAADMHQEAEVIEKIAGEEYSHACAIRKMLEDNGVDIAAHPDMKALWHKARSVFDN